MACASNVFTTQHHTAVLPDPSREERLVSTLKMAEKALSVFREEGARLGSRDLNEVVSRAFEAVNTCFLAENVASSAPSSALRDPSVAALAIYLAGLQGGNTADCENATAMQALLGNVRSYSRNGGELVNQLAGALWKECGSPIGVHDDFGNVVMQGTHHNGHGEFLGTDMKNVAAAVKKALNAIPGNSELTSVAGLVMEVASFLQEDAPTPGFSWVHRREQVDDAAMAAEPAEAAPLPVRLETVNPPYQNMVISQMLTREEEMNSVLQTFGRALQAFYEPGNRLTTAELRFHMEQILERAFAMYANPDAIENAAHGSVLKDPMLGAIALLALADAGGNTMSNSSDLIRILDTIRDHCRGGGDFVDTLAGKVWQQCGEPDFPDFGAQVMRGNFTQNSKRLATDMERVGQAVAARIVESDSGSTAAQVARRLVEMGRFLATVAPEADQPWTMSCLRPLGTGTEKFRWIPEEPMPAAAASAEPAAPADTTS